MKTLYGIVLLAFALNPCAAQSDSGSPDHLNEIIVMFKRDSIIAPAGRTAGTLSEFVLPSARLRTLFNNAGVERMSKLAPNFKREDVHKTNRLGKPVRLNDWSDVYVVRLADKTKRDGLLKLLAGRQEIVFAEPNVEVQLETIPNDPHFGKQWMLKNDGTAAHGSGSVNADIDADLAWDITTGSSNIKIAFVDNGLQTNHPDFTGRVTGDASIGVTNHGTIVAGVAAAKGNNGIGIAGVAWNVGIVNEEMGYYSAGTYSSGNYYTASAALQSAINRGADVINNSWSVGLFTLSTGGSAHLVRMAIADAYNMGIVVTAAMGNQYGDVVRYPAAFKHGIISVGATTNNDIRADYSNRGDWIDVVAPGGSSQFEAGTTDEDGIYSTVDGSSYGYYVRLSDGNNYRSAGTSFSTPAVSGIAALLLSYNPYLSPDDVDGIIKYSADDKGASGYDVDYGYGRVNARRALDFLRPPYYLQRNDVAGGYDAGAIGNFHTVTFIGASGIQDGAYTARLHEVRKTVNFFPVANYHVWGRGSETTGWLQETRYDGDYCYGMGFCEVVPGTVTSTSAVLRTYVYEVYYPSQTQPTWYPASPANVTFGYTVHGTAAPLVVDIIGPTQVPLGGTGSWHSSLQGQYSYKWLKQGVLIGTNFSVSTVVSDVFTLRLIQSYEFGSAEDAIQVYPYTGGGGCEEPLNEGIGINAPPCFSKTAGRETEVPREFELSQNYPNPFNPTTTIRFAIPEATNATLRIYNLQGQLVRTLFGHFLATGFYDSVWNGRDDTGHEVASGIYIYRLEAGRFIQSKKMTFVK